MTDLAQLGESIKSALGGAVTAATIARGESHGLNIHVDGLFFHRDVVACVRIRATNDCDVHLEWLVAQNVPAVDLQHLDQGVSADLIASAGIIPRIDKCPKTGVSEETGASRTDLAQEVLHDSAGEAIGLHLIVFDHLLHAG